MFLLQFQKRSQNCLKLCQDNKSNQITIKCKRYDLKYFSLNSSKGSEMLHINIINLYPFVSIILFFLNLGDTFDAKLILYQNIYALESPEL